MKPTSLINLFLKKSEVKDINFFYYISLIYELTYYQLDQSNSLLRQYICKVCVVKFVMSLPFSLLKKKKKYLSSKMQVIDSFTISLLTQ